MAAQISVDRLSLVLSAAPGTSRLGVVTLKNEGATTAQATIQLMDWDRTEDGANRFHPLGTVTGSCGGALQVFPATVSLEPGEAQPLRITLDSMMVFQGRECWLAAVVESPEPRPLSRTGVTYRLRTAIKIYVEPPGLPVQGDVEALHIVPDSTPAVELVLRNTGGRHFEGRGEVQVRTPDNAVIRTIGLPTAYLLPGARGRVRALLPELPSGRYVLLAIVDYGGTDLAAGQLEYVAP